MNKKPIQIDFGFHHQSMSGNVFECDLILKIHQDLDTFAQQNVNCQARQGCIGSQIYSTHR
jgi:hypothetical protein